MKNKPNILIIHADEHRFDCLGAYGNKDIKTPNIDMLAKDGVIYNNSFCAYPVCTPSRYSLLSGLYVSQHSGWTNHCTLPSHIQTFPKVLRENGYSNAAVGKMHFTPTYLDVGFDRMKLCEQNGEGRYDDDYHRELMDKNLYDKIDLMGEVKEYRDKAPDEFWDTLSTMDSNLPDDMSSTGWIGAKAIEEIQDWQEDGNLLMVGFVKPHHPFDPSKPWSDMYDPKDITMLSGWIDECLDIDIQKETGFFEHKRNTKEMVINATAYYYSAISQIDYEVGKMISLLKEKGQYDNTIIVYTSDHGDYMGYHHMMLKGNYMYEPLIKIPLIIKHVNSDKATQVVDSLVSNVDMAKTLLYLVGIEVPNEIGGYNLETEKRDYVVAQSNESNCHMIHDGRYKLLLCNEDKKSQFFDLQLDPLEMDNSYNDDEYAQDIQKLKNKLLDWALFESTTPVLCDEHAKIIDKENAVKYDEKRRKITEDYYRKKMSK